MSVRARLALSLAWWCAGPAFLFTIWLVLRYVTPGMAEAEQGYRVWFQTEFFPDGLNPAAFTPLAWFGIAIWLLGQSVIFGVEEPDSGGLVGMFLSVVAAVAVLGVPFLKGIWDNDKDTGRYYLTQTVFHLPADSPPSAAALLNGAGGKSGRCDARGAPRDIRSCIDTDAATYKPGWAGRTSSLNGALKNLNNTASTLPKVDVYEQTATYLYGDDEGWSVLLDGSGYSQPLYGVAMWDGATNSTQVCRFGKGTFNRAFGGERRNDLHNWIAEHFRDLLFQDSDVWGYCEGAPDKDGRLPAIEDRTPVIVIPVQRAVPYEVQTVRTAAGVIVLRGSADGNPKMTYRPTVKAGEYPGPVYPMSLVQRQRCATEWAAGRGARDPRRGGFGYSPAADDVTPDQECDDDQSPAGAIGNTSEFVLKSTTDNRLYYVTPIAPRTSKSQAVVGYLTSPADQVTSGQLNPMDVHLLPGGINYANINTAVSDAQDYLATTKPGFISSGGRLAEYIPLDGDRWRIFGEMRGQTRLYLDVSASRRFTPQIVDLLPGTATTHAAPADVGRGTACGRPPAAIADNRVLVKCASGFLFELNRRQPALP